MALDGSPAAYYRSRASMIRTLAEKTSVPGLKEEYERIAERYEQLAIEVETGPIGR